MFSQTADYALRAAVCLSQADGAPLTTQQIADATHVPVGYLYKVLQSLGRAALVTSRRGLYGGYALARAPAEICLLDVINAVHPIQRITTCPLGLAIHARALCRLHKRLDRAIATIEQTFAETSLADLLVADGSADTSLCARDRRADDVNEGRPGCREARPGQS